jgi:hypothetical protein
MLLGSITVEWNGFPKTVKIDPSNIHIVTVEWNGLAETVRIDPSNIHIVTVEWNGFPANNLKTVHPIK